MLQCKQRRLTCNLIDLRTLLQDLVSQFLGRGQHLCVVFGYEVLHELLQLLSVHLQQGFWKTIKTTAVLL